MPRVRILLVDAADGFISKANVAGRALTMIDAYVVGTAGLANSP